MHSKLLSLFSDEITELFPGQLVQMCTLYSVMSIVMKRVRMPGELVGQVCQLHFPDEESEAGVSVLRAWSPVGTVIHPQGRC